MTQTLGNLSQVPLRTIWPHEAADFTPWLASEENVFAGMKRSVNAPQRPSDPTLQDLTRTISSDSTPWLASPISP